MKKLLIIGLVLSASLSAIAQDGWNWPEQVDIAKTNNALYSDAVKSKQFITAVEPHQWLIDNCPDLNESLYINGAKVYEGLEAAEADAAKKSEYQVKALQMYDDRIKYFGGESKVLNRKAFKAYKFYKSDKSQYKFLIDLFDKTVNLNGNKTLDNNLVAYMDVVRRFKLSGGELSDEEVIERYGIISDIISAKNTAKSNVKYDKYQENVDKLLTATVDVNCEFIETKLVPKMNENKDPRMAKKVFQLMLSAKCSDSPAFVEAGEIVYNDAPSFGIAKVLAIKYTAAGNKEKALEYYEAALTLSDEKVKKAEIYMSQGQAYVSMGKKSQARASFRQAIANDPSSAANAYTSIGNMYMSSYDGCKQGVSKVDDRLVFIAAYNQYKKAGNASAMDNAKAQFPSISEIFELGHTEGQSMTVGCWINETVLLERRPN